ncbi:MAG: SDR family NAD(P)-dependent oxidoreductase [Chloroflexota bacterium]
MDGIAHRFALEGKAALVTGASRGIGRTIALALAEAGADVVAAARTLPDLERLCAEIRERGREAVPCYLDVARCETMDAPVRAAVERFGRLDILINNAGVSRRQAALDVTEDEWDGVFDTNVKGLFFCAQAAARVLAAQGWGGKIVNVASALAFAAAADLAVYAASKAAVAHLTRVLALEWATHRIAVNAIAPTTTETPLMAARLADPAVRAAYERNIPLGRVGQPDDLVGALLFLASPASDFVTGQTIVVDGGFTLR